MAADQRPAPPPPPQVRDYHPAYAHARMLAWLILAAAAGVGHALAYALWLRFSSAPLPDMLLAPVPQLMLLTIMALPLASDAAQLLVAQAHGGGGGLLLGILVLAMLACYLALQWHVVLCVMRRAELLGFGYAVQGAAAGERDVAKGRWPVMPALAKLKARQGGQQGTGGGWLLHACVLCCSGVFAQMPVASVCSCIDPARHSRAHTALTAGLPSQLLPCPGQHVAQLSSDLIGPSCAPQTGPVCARCWCSCTALSPPPPPSARLCRTAWAACSWT